MASGYMPSALLLNPLSLQPGHTLLCAAAHRLLGEKRLLACAMPCAILGPQLDVSQHAGNACRSNGRSRATLSPRWHDSDSLLERCLCRPSTRALPLRASQILRTMVQAVRERCPTAGPVLPQLCIHTAAPRCLWHRQHLHRLVSCDGVLYPTTGVRQQRRPAAGSCTGVYCATVSMGRWECRHVPPPPPPLLLPPPPPRPPPP